MKFLTTYLQLGEEVQYRARIHIFLFRQPVLLLGIGFMCYLDSVSITHYLGVTLLFLGLVSVVQRVFVKVGSIYAVTNRQVIIKTGVISRRTVELVLAEVRGHSGNTGHLGAYLRVWLHRGYYGRGDQLLLLRCQSFPLQTGDKYANCLISDVNKRF